MKKDTCFAYITCAALLCTVAAAHADVAPAANVVAPVAAQSPVVSATPVPAVSAAPVVIVETVAAPDVPPIAERGAFDMVRWENVLDTIRARVSRKNFKKDHRCHPEKSSIYSKYCKA